MDIFDTKMNASDTLTDAEIEALSEERARLGYLCPLIAFHRIAGGKYKLRILWLLRNQERRYSDLRRGLVTGCKGAPITPRVLSRELKELANRGLIERTERPGVPPRVDYRLTELGRTLSPIVDAILGWGMSGAQLRMMPEAGPDRLTATARGPDSPATGGLPATLG